MQSGLVCLIQAFALKQACQVGYIRAAATGNIHNAPVSSGHCHLHIGSPHHEPLPVVRDLEEGMNNGNKYAKAAMEVFCYRVAKYIGSYVAAMNGVDAIAFTAGIGENAGTVRKMVVSYLGYLGITLDEEANKKRGEDLVISTADSKVKVAVIPTNEELAIARETVALV